MARAVLVVALLLAACEAGAGTGADGRALFETTCARCHGADGHGEEISRIRLQVPDMTLAEFQVRVTDDDIRRAVRQGSKSKKMPGFGTYYNEAQLDALVRHVRRLGGR